MEKDEDINDHYSHRGIANSKLGGDKILSRFLSEPNKFFQPIVRTGPKPHKKVIVT